MCLPALLLFCLFAIHKGQHFLVYERTKVTKVNGKSSNMNKPDVTASYEIHLNYIAVLIILNFHA